MDIATMFAIVVTAIVGVSAGYGLRVYLSKPKG